MNKLARLVSPYHVKLFLGERMSQLVAERREEILSEKDKKANY